RPVSRVELEDGRFGFAVPPQWEAGKDDLTFEGRLADDQLQGETTDDVGRRSRWTARRAPSLKRDREPKWGQAIELFNGKDLSGWKARSPKAKHGWTVRDGLLVNATPFNDLVSERTLPIPSSMPNFAIRKEAIAASTCAAATKCKSRTITATSRTATRSAAFTAS